MFCPTILRKQTPWRQTPLQADPPPGWNMGPDNQTESDIIPPCEQTDRCKHITLSQTSFAGDNKYLAHMSIPLSNRNGDSEGLRDFARPGVEMFTIVLASTIWKGIPHPSLTWDRNSLRKTSRFQTLLLTTSLCCCKFASFDKKERNVLPTQIRPEVVV